MKVVVTGGGTGGHVFPGIAVAKALQSEEVLYVGSFRGLERKVAERYGIPFCSIHSRALVGKGLLGKLTSLGYLGTGFLEALRILMRFKPSIVIGTGGYVSSPVLLAAVVLRVPALVLEQNVLPGRTTRWLSKFVSHVLASFEESRKFLPKASVRVTGNPVRPEIGSLDKEEGCRRLGISSEYPVICIMGASQGARALNRCLLQALPFILSKPWQILHLTGEAHYAEVCEESRRFLSQGKIRYKAFPFVEAMEAVYAASDLMVCRAGATTLSEILIAGKPSLLVPYPYAAENHQEINARWLEARGGCKVVLEEDLTPPALAKLLEEWLADPDSLVRMGQRAHQAASPGALSEILKVIRETGRAAS